MFAMNRRTCGRLDAEDDGKEAEAHRAQPRALFARRESDIDLGPPARRMIVVAVEACRAEPVLPREITAVANPEAPLFPRVDEKQAA